MAIRKKISFHEGSVNALRNFSVYTPEAFHLATEMALFMADKLNEHGIKTVVVSDEKARRVLEQEHTLSSQGRSSVEFSMRDIMNLSYTWNGEEVSMLGFAEQFMSEIKQKDRTMEDAERIAKTFIEAVKADPEKAGMKMLKAENMANAFRFKLPDGTIYTPEHPMADSPEYETQKGLWEIYEYVLGKETMREFIGLLSKNAPMSQEERKRYSEQESKVNGSDIMQRSLENPASKVNENRVKDIRNLIQYFEGNDDYTWTEKALIVKGAMSFGYSEKKEADSTRVEIKNISDNNSVSVPVIGGEAAAVVEGLRKGLNFKDALVQARIMLSKESKRSVGGNFTGWKVYKQSDKEEDAVILNQDVAGTGWCTGGAVSTARSHLSGGDFHVYYEAGEPQIAIRTVNGRMAEPPRGAHEGQFCKPREEQIAFDYIRSGNGIVAGDDYIADIEDIRRVMSPNATPLDAFMMPGGRRYENGEFGGDTKAWGTSVKQRIAELVPSKKEERWKLGLYCVDEIEHACKNGNAIAIKGRINLFGSSLILPEGVTRVGNIELHRAASLTLPKGVTQVGDIELSNGSSLILLEGVTKVGNVELNYDSSLILPEGVTQVGGIGLHDSSLTLPKGVMQVGEIALSEGSSLTLPKGVTRVGDIKLIRSSLTLPKEVTQVDDIVLCGGSSLTLPKGVTKVGGIRLDYDSSLTLPEGVTKVGNIELDNNSSLILPKGVTQVEAIILVSKDCSLTLPKDVTQVDDIVLQDGSSLSLPEGVTKVGKIRLYDRSSLTLPEGVTKVGDIELRGSASLTLPEGVTKVGRIILKGSSLTLPKEVTQVGGIVLYDGSLSLPEGVTQVGRLYALPGCSISFPDGYVLKNSDNDALEYSAEEMNQLLSEHQKKQEFRLADGTIYGYQQGDTIYLTPAGINPNTPIHEYAHLWAKVYEKIEPEEWESLKEELKATPLWAEIANSPSYSFIDNDENRLAGEVLATIVGNRGEELLLSAASKTLEEGKRTSSSVIKGAGYFREMLTEMAVIDVFDAQDMPFIGEVTLKVLKDFAEGKGVKITNNEANKLLPGHLGNKYVDKYDIGRRFQYQQRSRKNFSIKM